MRTLIDIVEMQSMADGLRKQGNRIGFVPTMGFFHEGHLSLMRKAKELSDVVVVSLFVNPAQFGPGEDFEEYPRDEERDSMLAMKNGCDVLFVPGVEGMYPKGYATYVQVNDLSTVLCGASRPGHFQGVTTVVTKLFNIVKPHVAIFGQKDAQQAIIIRRIAEDLNYGVDIVIAPIVRESDGLAMSSRNMYLNRKERAEAVVLHQSLLEAEKLIAAGERRAHVIREAMKSLITAKDSARIDYVSILDADTLQPLDLLQGRILIALAVRFGKARLIDNTIMTC
ncbi:MAG: pantoate--beta-alanine ligase [Gemmatimonadota bacterium]|nr:MAG: pantoate--beta-alanine ligase [Gemmatimonadota bacterium]